MTYDEWLEKENPFSGNDDNYDCQWASKFMRKSYEFGYEAGERSKQEKIDNLLSYVESGGHTPNWILREFLK